MKINILPEIEGEIPSKDVAKKFYETIQVLYDEFGTVQEVGSIIKVDLFKFIFIFEMIEKSYQFEGDELNIELTYKKTKEII